MVIEFIMAIYAIGFSWIVKDGLPLIGAWLAVSAGVTVWAFKVEKERQHGIQG